MGRSSAIKALRCGTLADPHGTALLSFLSVCEGRDARPLAIERCKTRAKRIRCHERMLIIFGTPLAVIVAPPLAM
jgi:hypothetical protein